MYLLEGQKEPDHNTIARFRSQHLPEAVEDLLEQMVQLLVVHGEISFEESAVFIDGTKIEDNAGIYIFVWKTRVSKDQEKLGNKIATEFPLLLEKAGVGIVAPQQIKEDMNFRRFMMRGKKNVNAEWHLVSMAYNILKLHHKI